MRKTASSRTIIYDYMTICKAIVKFVDYIINSVPKSHNGLCTFPANFDNNGSLPAHDGALRIMQDF